MMKHTAGDAGLLIVTLLLASLSAFAQDGSERGQVGERPAVIAADFGVPQTWGAANNVVSVKHLYFSGQPDAATFDEARKNGVRIVINLREPTEFDWDEAGAVDAANLTYYNVPIAVKDASFDAAAIDEIAALVRRHDDEKILLHCSSGNRAAAWLAIHLALDHHMDTESSVSLASKAGLSNSVIQARVRQFLNDNLQLADSVE